MSEMSSPAEDSSEEEVDEDALLSPAGSMSSLRRRAAAEGVVLTGREIGNKLKHWQNMFKCNTNSGGFV